MPSMELALQSQPKLYERRRLDRNFFITKTDFGGLGHAKREVVFWI